MIKSFVRKYMNGLWTEFKIFKGKKKIIGLQKNEEKIFIFLAADYGNMGDVAITYAQKLFLEDTFKGYKVIEIPANETLDYIKFIKSIINKNDIVTTVGGGNMGDIYEYYESLRRIVIKKFKKNIFISFPQTIDFSTTKRGKKSLNKTIARVKKHKKILIIAREKKSYNEMKKYFGAEKVILTPDIVLYLKNKIKFDDEKKGKVALCFRDDKEVNKEYEQIIHKIQEKYSEENAEKFDTVINEKEFNYENRYEILNAMLERIATYEKIYTNRLHAMIFSYITNTECFFIDNSNKKISETYKQWLCDCPKINPAIDEENVLLRNSNDLSINFLLDEFTKMKSTIINMYEKYSK